MRNTRRITDRRSALCAVLTGLTLLAGCSGAGQTRRRADIDPAIALFVSGQYEQAIERLDRLAETTSSEEELREVYYYLGRAHLALEQYDAAIDAFAAGVSYGDTGACVDYLEQLRVMLEGKSRNVRRSETVSRRQVASALAREFIFEGDESPAPGDPDETLRLAISRGWMRALPDGELHGESPLTRAAFYVVVARLTSQFGFGRTLLPTLRADLRAHGTEPVTGAEVSATLEELSGLRKKYGG